MDVESLIVRGGRLALIGIKEILSWFLLSIISLIVMSVLVIMGVIGYTYDLLEKLGDKNE